VKMGDLDSKEPTGPDDLSVFKMEQYDEEESKGVGQSVRAVNNGTYPVPSLSYGRFRQRERTVILPRQQ